MVRVGEAMALSQQGDRAGARSLFLALWEEVGPDGDPFHRCAIAHSMADVQDAPGDELVWDLRALEAADVLTDERVAAGGVPGSVGGFYPSLHLNLADVYLRLGDGYRAAEHVVACKAALGALEESGYKQMIVEAVERVDGQLESI
jgi:hypothetical protein